MHQLGEEFFFHNRKHVVTLVFSPTIKFLNVDKKLVELWHKRYAEFKGI